MTTTRHQSAPAQEAPREEGSDSLRAAMKPLLDLSGIDLRAVRYTRQDIERYNPHRGEMALLDSIVWTSDDFRQGIAHKHVRPDEFWVPGHFPGKAMMPGVLMLEAGAQLACFLYQIRRPDPKIVAFLRIEECSFRAMVAPGDDFYILCHEVKFGRRQFESDNQGMVHGKIAFSARISGMSMQVN